MAKIAFFSDDGVGEVCARLVGLGLSILPGTTALALPGNDVAAAPSCAAPAGVSVVTLPVCPGPLTLADEAEDIVVALPLDAARDPGLRNSFDAAVAVGVGEAAAARALRSARYVSSHGYGTVGVASPVWFLPVAGQSEVPAKATLSGSGRLVLPFATRVLPMALPRLTPADRYGLDSWEPNAAVRGTGLLLAALVLCVTADPRARRLKPGDVADRMAARASEADRALSHRLGALAEAYGRLDGVAAGSVPPARPPCRRTVPMRPGSSTLSRHDVAGRAGTYFRRA